MPDLDDALLCLARAAARDAGQLLTKRRPDRLGFATKTSPTDVVTAMDTAAEELILARLRAARPDDAVLAEEGGAHRGGSGVRWVIDPLDGTVNYLYGIPQYAVSLAAEVDGVVRVGVVYDPTKDELYSAVRGAGAWLNDQPLHCSAVSDLSQALIATGFGYSAGRRARQAMVVAEVLPRARDIRRLGAAALDLCAVACGRVDGFYELGLSPWDLAAGQLIAREAGVIVAGLHGAPAGAPLTIAAPPGLFEPLHDLLAGLGADQG